MTDQVPTTKTPIASLTPAKPIAEMTPDERKAFLNEIAKATTEKLKSKGK
jgi:hypothetical protein